MEFLNDANRSESAISSSRSLVYTEYKHLLKSLKLLIPNLSSSDDAILCLLWLARLDEAAPDEFALRNKLLEQLYGQLKNKKLRPPFKNRPPNQLTNEKLLSKKYIKGFLFPDVISSLLKKNTCCCMQLKTSFFEERRKRAQAQLTEYQKLIQELNIGNKWDLNKLRGKNPLSLKSQRHGYDPSKLSSVRMKSENNDTRRQQNMKCYPAASTEIVIEANSSQANKKLIQRLEELEENQKIFAKKCKCLNTNTNNADNNSPITTNNIEQMASEFQRQLELMVQKKDAEIEQLEEKLANCSLNMSKSELSTFDQTIKSKCNRLEEKYRSIVKNLETKLSA